ncbi:MAG: hypothetical protein MI919_11420, partial [Holophagales bacterium]|nr:hypothetical protein [Holophagales bacterium]
LRGRPAHVRTDLFALGLVLYEMFTGEKAFEDEDWLQMVKRGGRADPPTPPSMHVEGLSPEVEVALLAALDEDPSERPASALEIAARLPGGDPLAAALAAGETPSPEMVAAAPDPNVLSPRVAFGGFLAVLLLLAASHWLGTASLLGMVNPIKSPSVLEDRAQRLLDELGWQGPVTDRVGAYRFEEARIAAGARELSSETAWRERAGSRPMLLTYWYRQAPAALLPWRIAWSPEPFDPPPIPREALVVLDARGRLELLRREGGLGEPEDLPTGDAPTPDWRPLFRAAELEESRFRTAEIEGLPIHGDLPDHDRRWAWVGVDERGGGLRIEAASLAGEPVYFELAPAKGPGADARTVPSGSVRARPETPIPAGQGTTVALFLLLMGAALVLTYRHLRRGRADRRGATVLGLTVGTTSFVGLLLGAHHPPTEDGFYLLLEILEATAFRGSAVVLVYLALE